MIENPSRTAISELGEFGLIDHLTKKVELQHASSKKGVGDDAAVIDAEGKMTVVTTDLLTEGIHFDLTYVPLKHLGYKAVVVNLSDVYAMNATPSQITVSLAVSAKFPVEALDALYEGILLACKRYNVDLVGGDTTSSAGGLTISITALGHVNENDIVYRDGASNGDLLVVSGDLGGAYMGLQVLEREKAVFKESPDVQPDLGGKDYILERQLKPEARKDVIEMFKQLELKPTAMIDISDGLSSEIFHLCKASNVGCELYEDKIPIDPTTHNTAREFNLDSTICALSGGEDYELLFTIKQEDYDKVKGSPHFTVIGHMTGENDGKHMISRGGQSITLEAQGWNAFDQE